MLLVHYKKEQLMAGMLSKRLRATTVWAEWGPVPMPLRSGIPRLAYLAAASRAALVMAVSEGTRRSVADVGVGADEAGGRAERAAHRGDPLHARMGAGGCARSWASPRTRSWWAASRAFTPRSATTSWSAR